VKPVIQFRRSDWDCVCSIKPNGIHFLCLLLVIELFLRYRGFCTILTYTSSDGGISVSRSLRYLVKELDHIQPTKRGLYDDDLDEEVAIIDVHAAEGPMQIG
jgi:hypothetical protein